MNMTMGGDLAFGGLLVVAVVAVVAPLLADVLPIKIPAVVLEIVAGIVIGPSGLGWVSIDAPIAVISVVGLAFLLFLAGLEIDVRALRGSLLRLPLVGYALTIAIGLVAGVGLRAAGWAQDPLFIAIALSATSLGLVIPVLKDAGAATRPVGQYAIAGATFADVAAVILLSLLFSESGHGVTGTAVTLGALLAVAVGVTFILAGAGRNRHVDMVLVRLQDTTAEIRVRGSVALLIGFVALATHVGLEVILGAFIAGAVLGLVDRDTDSHPRFRAKLDAIGYGFLIPVFFVTSGLRFDLDALTANPAAIARIPVLLVALLAARGLPALLYRRRIGTRSASVAGLLQATSLPFLVTAAELGVAVRAVSSVTAAALVAAGLVSVVVFPPLALANLDRSPADDTARAVLVPTPAGGTP